MTELQLKFVDAYMEVRKGAPAARIAGYSKETAKQEAYKLLQNEEVKLEIERRFAALIMTANQAASDFTDIASTRLNDYLKVNQVLRAPMIRKPLQQLIDELDREIAFEEEFAKAAKLTGDDLKAHKTDQKKRELQGIRYALELEHYPSAYRDVKGESVYQDEVSIDLVALAKAKRRGRIKKLKIDSDGTTAIEMYPADNALGKLLEFHGKMIQKHEHTFAELDNLSPEQLEQLQRLQQVARSL